MIMFLGLHNIRGVLMVKYPLIIGSISLILSSGFAFSGNEAPEKGSDEYAEYVISRGSQQPLNVTQRYALSSAISRSVVASYDSLIDRHTAAAIEYTLIDALFGSPTFQHAVAFGRNNNMEDLGQIQFTNEYEVNPDQSDFEDIDDVSIEDIEDAGATDSPIFISHEAREDDDGNPIVNIGVAPRVDSNEYPWWQEALIHEVIHHITGSSDAHSETRHGPTEIMAQRVANERHWPIPVFRGYDDPARIAGLRDRNYYSLIHAFERHPAQAEVLMRRIAKIAQGRKASSDFNLLTAFCSSGKSEFPKRPDFDDDDNFSMGPAFGASGPAFFGGVSASSLTDPCNIDLSKRVTPVSDAITFEGGQKLIPRDLKNLNLRVAERAFSRAKNGGGFYHKNWDSWKAWYKGSGWKHLLGYGLYGYGFEQAKGNDFYNPYGLYFNDGSYSIGVVGQDVNDRTKSDNFVVAGSNWHTIQFAGQMFFDSNGRPVALVMTDIVTGAFGSGWSFIYRDGGWQYESQDDWDDRFFAHSTLSLDPYAPMFSR